jgi:hypothetical protein
MGGVDIRERDLETLLDLLQNILIIRAAHKGDTETFGSETTGTAHTMQVRVRLLGHVVVDGDIDTLNIDTTTEDIS